MKQSIVFNPQIIQLGKQLGLDAEQIQSILRTTQQTTEHLSFSQGPPQYPGSYYGTISISDFNITKK